MRLKCIKLSGFKSFVDPTTINFPSNLCAVVGPNGCGKSNVIDAVRWVMGESSAKNLRGEQMTDVIFNGSSARKPVGQASVELIFDNHDRKLSGEYANFSEVSIRRRVDREGLSSYALNGTKCRRRDITDIFLGTGLGARSYSIIEQGMVSRLIESKPEELRVYIEEAAGISRYKERRRETESRIKRTRDNLARLGDIREELERQLQHLKRQSVAAEKYAELKQQERETAANLNALRWQGLDLEIKRNQEAINTLQLSLEAATAELRALDARVEKHLADNADLTDALGEVQARFYSLGNDIARIEQSIEHHIERVDQLRLDLSETEEGWVQTREELDLDLRKVTELDAELRSVSPRLEEVEASAAQSSARLAEAEQAVRQCQQQWDEFNQGAEEPRQTAEVEQSRIQQLETVVEQGLQRKQKLEAELAQLAGQSGEPDPEAGSQAIAGLEQQVETLQSELEQCGGEIDRDRRALQGCGEELDRVREELQTSRGRLASLEALQQAALGQDDSELAGWLQQQGLDGQQRLGENISIAAGWERAVEVVLGDSLQAVYIDDPQRIETIIRDLPQGKLALIDASSRAVDAGAGRQQEFPLLAGKVQTSWQIAELLHGIYAAEDLQQALSWRGRLAANESVVTPDGVWLGCGWIQLCKQGAEDTVARRRGLIAETFRKIKAQTEQAEALAASKSTLLKSQQQAEQRRDQLQAETVSRNRELSELRSERGARLARVEQVRERQHTIEQELEELSRQLTQEQDKIAAARARLQTALDQMAADQGRREELETARKQSQTDLEQSRERARQDRDQAHELALQHQSIRAQLQSTRETMDRMASQVQRSKERIQSLSSQINDSDQPLSALREELEGLLQKRLEVEKELAVAKSRVDENEHAIRGLEQQRSSVQQNLDALREQLLQKQLKSEGSSVKRDTLVEQLRQAGFEPEPVLERLPEELGEADCEQELERLGNRIQRLGPINLAAIDEYEQQSERKIYLDRQNEDLEKALRTLQNAIRKIDKETRTRFKETFDKINASLQALFPRIFGGGHAYLDMTGEDLLDTGVAIMARPPGKRNSTIHLLSGGEKAMTAIALVFSIFSLNPSPFCMLDEVDAPLDDANVTRYANLVREMAANLQFIFITHNKITMEMANQLLGVTMHEAGVSRIVAVDIAEAAELAAM